MLDFSALDAIGTRTAARSQQKLAAAQDTYAAALAKLEAYRGSGAPELLKEAMGLLIRAAEAAPRQSEPLLLLLAYLYHGLALPQLAAKYLQLARGLAPDSPFLKSIEALLTGRQAIPLLPRQIAPDQLDQLYDDTAARLERLLLQLPPPPGLPGCTPASGLQQALHGVAEEQGLILEALAELEPEFDLAPLRRGLARLEARQQQLGAYLATCQQMAALAARIAGLGAQVEDALRHPEAAEARLEGFLDGCDLLADELDALSEKQIPIHELEPAYRQLVATLTRLQDTVDDLD